VAIGIPSGGFDPRLPAGGSRRAEFERPAPARGDEPPATRPAAEAEEVETARPARRVVQADSSQRVQRLGANADNGPTHRGISSYRGVEQASLHDSFGGELVGIDIFV